MVSWNSNKHNICRYNAYKREIKIITTLYLHALFSLGIENVGVFRC